MNKLKDHMLIGVVLGVLIPIVLYASAFFTPQSPKTQAFALETSYFRI